MHELGCDGTVNASANGTNDTSLGSTYLSYACDLLSDELFLEKWIGKV